ncbi:MAG: DUF58 domain-containing protein [Planctomycetes bacterium]|nr:DUF58 domain-containing protein [Planctomycetota bacterium]
MRNDPEVQRACEMYQLGLPRSPVAGRSGELLGSSTGSSLEFQEYREYLPGDDIRHLDWAAYARSDQLMVRLYREEVSPRVEILLDTSRSMATGRLKQKVARQLATLFALLAGALGSRASVFVVGDERPARALPDNEPDSLTDIPFEAKATLADLLADGSLALRRRSVRIVISDLLFPHSPESVSRRLADGASTLWVLQLLTAWESAPTPEGARHLVDVETGESADLLINEATIAVYKQRLRRLQDEWSRHCRRLHATFVTLVADHGLDALCRGPLGQAGVLVAG